jgi:hypothetical protein
VKDAKSQMKSNVLLASLLVLSLIGLFPSVGYAECGEGDTGICDTVRIGCPFIIGTVIPGDSIMVPIYVWNDLPLGGLTLGFKFDSAELEVVKKRYDLMGSIIPENVRTYIKETTTLPGQYIFGWFDFDGDSPIPANATGKAKLLVTLNFKIKSTATPRTIVIDSAFFPTDGYFVLWSLEGGGSSVHPQYVHCPDGDIILGDIPCGDADGSGSINISDIVYMINYIFKNGPPPQDTGGGDIDCDLRVTIADIVYLINYVFKGGLTPCFECR